MHGAVRATKRREGLDRSRLTHQHYAEDVTAGLHETGAKKGKGKPGRKVPRDRGNCFRLYGMPFG